MAQTPCSQQHEPLQDDIQHHAMGIVAAFELQLTRSTLTVTRPEIIQLSSSITSEGFRPYFSLESRPAIKTSPRMYIQPPTVTNFSRYGPLQRRHIQQSKEVATTRVK